MSQALYRKYRSRALAEVVGQEHITDTLGRAIKAGRISHAYLFTGPRGTGKTSVARILAHEINSLPYTDATNLDIVEIDAASNRRIDDIRDLREKVHIAPISAKYKVYIIDEVHMLTGESFNALLKTLEEPPAHVVFILATTEVHKLPATIISRTQRFAFKPGTKQKIISHLAMVAQKEAIQIDDAALELIAEHSDGGFRDSLSLLDQLTHISTKKITAEDVASTLGLARKDQIDALTAAIIAQDRAAILTTLSAIEGQGSNTIAIVNQLIQNLLALGAQHPELFYLIDKLLDIPRAYNPSLKLISTLTTLGDPPQQPPPVKTEAASSAALMAAPAPITIAEIPIKKSLPATPQLSGEPLEDLQPADWQLILQLAKEKSPPLYAILKHAQPMIDDKKLVLKFKFGLMAKKLDDPKQKAGVAELVQQAIGKTPSVQIITDKTAIPPPAAPNPHVSSVTAIMGGGEVVHGETI